MMFTQKLQKSPVSSTFKFSAAAESNKILCKRWKLISLFAGFEDKMFIGVFWTFPLNEQISLSLQNDFCSVLMH